jgi:tRNA pseudouridine55 synthase
VSVARRHKGRQLDGVFLLDKPPGLSSNGVLQYVKRLYGAAKAGHTGALDPLATGMLPLTFGEGTKFSQFLLDADKRYQTTAKLGIRTDSSDADGAVVEEKTIGDHVNQALIESLINDHFRGEIEQVPSMFSALKHNGQPLYKLARKGEKVAVKPRKVRILEISLLDYRPEMAELDLDIRCSKGTYIRSIVEDLGLLLGCGAHVQKLRRLESGPYKKEMMITMAQLEQLVTEHKVVNDEAQEESSSALFEQLDSLLLPIYSPIEHLEKFMLDGEQKAAVFQGKKIKVSAEPAEVIRLHMQSDDSFVGIGVISEQGVLSSKRLLNTSD